MKRKFISLSILILISPFLGNIGMAKVWADTVNPATSSSAGGLSDMVDGLGSLPESKLTQSPVITDKGIFISGRFYTNEEFSDILQNSTLEPNAPEFTIVNNQVELEIEPRFAFVLPLIPVVAPWIAAGIKIAVVAGATLVIGDTVIKEGTPIYNSVVYRLNSQQKARIAAAKAKSGKAQEIEEARKKIPSRLKDNKGNVKKGEFKQKVPGKKVKFKDPKTGWTISKDLDGHSGSDWKIENSQGKRIGSIKDNGEIVGK